MPPHHATDPLRPAQAGQPRSTLGRLTVLSGPLFAEPTRSLPLSRGSFKGRCSLLVTADLPHSLGC